jgi:hypothetical protein
LRATFALLGQDAAAIAEARTTHALLRRALEHFDMTAIPKCMDARVLREAGSR